MLIPSSLSLLICMTTLSSFAYSATAATSQITMEQATQEIVKESTEFSLSFYKVINENTNIIFSPYSIFSSLSMAYEGARGETAAEMKQAMNLNISLKMLPKALSNLSAAFSSLEKNTYQLHFANGMWLQKGTFILSDYRHLILDDFNAKIHAIDFSQEEKARTIINDWISMNTEDKIPELIQPGDIDASTRIVLANAVYFQGAWQIPFDIKNTKCSSFFPQLQQPLSVMMMETQDFFSYYEDDTAQTLALPFKKSNENVQLACLIVLPKSQEGIASLESTLSMNLLQKHLDGLEKQNVNVKLPRFTLMQRIDLNQSLQKLGINNAFSNTANFSGIDGLQDLFLSKVIHQAFFALDEHGVTAAAASAAAVGVKSAPLKNPPVAFNADHPFIFMIVDLNSKAILFLGKLQEPTPATCH